jgi:hypothetical protein
MTSPACAPEPRETAAAPPVAELVAIARRNKALLDAVAQAQARLLLARARLAAPDVWSEPEPLVSVRIATYDRPAILVERAIASVLRQTHRRFEIVVAGDHAAPETAAALARVGDPRVRYHNLPERSRYARFPRSFWETAGSIAMNAALDRCRGAWIAPLDDDDEWLPDHLEALLEAARAHRLEMVYGKAAAETADGRWIEIGSAPLAHGAICHATVLYSARLLHLRYDPFAWLRDEPGDWNMWRRMAEIGARIGFLPRVVARHYAEHTAVPADERRRLYERQPTPEELLADLLETGGEHLLALF